MTSSTSNSEEKHDQLPSRAAQWQALGKLSLRILLPLLLLGIVACLGLDWFVRHQLIDQTPSHGAAKLYRIQTPHPDEIPILGSSRALCTFIPDSLGSNYYNYGINGIGFAVMDIFLQRILSTRSTQPIVLNFDYEMFFYQMGDVNSYLPHTDIPGLRPLLERSEQYSGAMKIPGIRYYGCVDAFMKDRLNERLQLTKANNKGAAIDLAPFNAGQFAKQVKQRMDSTFHWKTSPELIDTLFQRLRAHPERQFEIVVAPYHHSYLEAMDAISRIESAALLARIDAEPNARVTNWNTKTWPDNLFMNTTHVNRAGAIHTCALLKAIFASTSAPISVPDSISSFSTDSISRH